MNYGPRNIKVLLSKDEDGVNKQWLLAYVKRNSLFTRMLQSAEDKNKLESFHSYDPKPKYDDYDYENGDYDNWIDAHFEDAARTDNDMSDESHYNIY